MLNSQEAKFLFDPYLDWAEREGVPVVEDFGVDMLKVETKPWARMGTDGAFVHLKGRGDWLAVFVIELPPGAKTAPQKHMYEEVHYVLSGYGSTTVELPDGCRVVRPRQRRQRRPVLELLSDAGGQPTVQRAVVDSQAT